MKTNATKLSIIVPAYNAARTLKPCLDAIRTALRSGDELIVVDDASSDTTFQIAQVYTDRVKRLPVYGGRASVRNAGAEMALGDILVFVDADVIIAADTLAKIEDYIAVHSEVAAVTGTLAKDHPNTDFFSQYKNLYMHFVLMQAPTKVHFLYGSLHAIRKSEMQRYDGSLSITVDTQLGRALVQQGKIIHLVKTLEVVHLKQYSAVSIIQNDFEVPLDWALIFILHEGWRQLGANGTGFAHASRSQLAAVVMAPLAFCCFVAAIMGMPTMIGGLGFSAIWSLLNLRFFKFLKSERGWVFALCSVPWTFVDHIIMASGILAGIFIGFSKRMVRRRCEPVK